MQKTTNRFGNVSYNPQVPTYKPPIIVDQFFDDNDELNYVLASGNTTLANRYNSMWHPIKSQPNWKAKDANPDRSRNYLK